ncbi:MAG: hypothetical protein EA402_02935 [Planctomycetota bacterium]|nr:MAG: hypothetical protein EA402_02935 [Planctomycetota bacterium]
MNPHLVAQGTEQIEKVLASHLDLVEQSRADLADSQHLARVLKAAHARVERWIALQQLNARLNRLRHIAGESPAEVDQDLSRTALLRLSVEAGLDLQRAAKIIDRARREGLGASSDVYHAASGEEPLNGPEVGPT